MGEIIKKKILTVVFGQGALLGFYDQQLNTEPPKEYIFESVFPDEETMKIALGVMNK